MKQIMLTIILMTTLSFAQQMQAGDRQDFRFDTETGTATFKQYNIQLFPKPDGGFAAAWIDEREGDPTYYAQQFSAAGNKVGPNYKTLTNKSIAFIENGSSLSITEKEYYYGGSTKTNIYGNFYDQSGRKLQTVFIDSTVRGWCGTGYLGYTYQTIGMNNKFYVLFYDQGAIYFSRFDSVGNAEIYSRYVAGGAASTTLAVRKDGNYFITWYGLSQATTLGVYGSFYSSNDSAFVSDLPLGFNSVEQDTLSLSLGYQPVKSIVVHDSMYEVFTAQKDKPYVFYRMFNYKGCALDSVRQVPLNIPYYVNVYSEKFSMSPMSMDGFHLILNSWVWDYSNYSYITSLLSFDSDGNVRGSAMNAPGTNYSIGDYFITKNDSTVLLGLSDSNDVFITRFQYLHPMDSLKINDDQSGGNETAPSITEGTNGNYFLTWFVDGEYKGRLIGLTGESRGPIRKLEGKKCVFFSNGNCINLWSTTPEPYHYQFGYTIYSPEWTIVRRDTINGVHSYNEYSNSMTLNKLNDSTCLIVTVKDQNNVNIAILNSVGAIKKEKSITTGFWYPNPGVFFTDTISFWLKHDDYIKRIANDLNTEEEDVQLNAAMGFDNNTFLVIDYPDWMARQQNYYGRIMNLQGDTLSQRIVLAENPSIFLCQKISADHFIVLLKKDNVLFARTYFANGRTDINSITISTFPDTEKFTPALTANGDNLLVAWSELRPAGTGYDLFGTSLSLSSITSRSMKHDELFPTRVTLYQNYPNPFNPTTQITYYMPEAGTANIRVFDILGKQVAELFNGYERAGEHAVTWNAVNVPSGVYYYRITTSSNTDTKKLIVLR